MQTATNVLLSRRRRSYFFILLALLLAPLLLLSVASPARAQVTVSKELCDVTGCASANVSPYVPVYYQITVNNPGPGIAFVDIDDTLPPGFHLTATSCGPTAGSQSPITPTTAQIANRQISPGSQICRLHGYFDASVTGANNQVRILRAGTNIELHSHSWSTGVNLLTPLPSDLSITKTADLSSLDISSGPQIVTYTITLENLGQNDLYLGSIFALQDRLSLLPSSVVLNARFVSAACAVMTAPANSGASPPSDCLNHIPTLPAPLGQPPNNIPLLIGYTGQHDFATWSYPQNSPGLLRVGDKVVLTVQVEVSTVPGADCVITPGADGFLQQAHLTFNLGSTSLADAYSTNNIASVPLSVDTGADQVNPACNAPFGPPSPVLQIAKQQLLPAPTGTATWNANPNIGPPVIYELTVRNISTATRVRNIRIRDAVRNGIGTPPFTASLISHTCPPADCAPGTAIPSQQLPGYGTVATMFDAVLFGGSTTLAPGASVTFLVRMHYSEPRCDSLRDNNVDPIDNLFQVLGWEEIDASNNVVTMNQIMQVGVTTRMQEADPCPLVVTKTAVRAPGPFPPPVLILFNQPLSYNVSFSNPTNTSYTLGTLIDTVRFAAAPSTVGPYAIQLRVDFSYSCTPSGGVSGHPTSGTGTVYAVANQLAQQGVRVIQNGGPVTFPANSSLACLVTVTVHPPATGDPYCSTAMFENAAILDMSAYYNANFPWSTSATGMWARVQAPLPRCYNWAVNKIASPTWTWQGGGPLSWTYMVTNLGAPLTTGGPVIRDQFTPVGNINTSVDVTSFSIACTNPPSSAPTPCTSIWLLDDPAAANPGATTTLIPQTFQTGQRLAVTLNVQNAPMSVAPGGQVCNNVSADFLTIAGGGSYWKNPQTLAAQACIPVLETAPLTLAKRVDNRFGVAVPQTFQISVTCTPYGPTNAVFNIPANGSATIARVPVGSQCAVSEVAPPRPRPTRTCAFPVWVTSYAPGATVSIVSPDNRVTVVNTVRCLPVGPLTIDKRVVNLVPGAVLPRSYQISVTCTPYGPTNAVFNLAHGRSQTLQNIPAGSQCTVTETPPPLPRPTPTCANPVWTTSYVPGAGVTIAASPSRNVVGVVNTLTCRPAGSLTVIKRVDNQVPGAALPRAFQIRVICTPAGSVVATFNLANGGSQTVQNIAPGSHCTITETQPPTPRPTPRCASPVWTTTYVPTAGVTIAAGSSSVTVVNTLTCGPVGSLVIRKETGFPPGVPTFASVTVNVSCTPGGPTTTVTVPANGQAVLNNIPAPSTCTVVEQIPPSPSRGCEWTVSQNPASPVTIPAGGGAVSVLVNRWSCRQTDGNIRIIKLVRYNADPAWRSPAVLAFPAIFTISFTCRPGPAGRVELYAGNGFEEQVTGVPTGANCSVAELPDPATGLPSHCHWETTYVPAQPFTYSGGQMTVEVRNEQKCSGLPRAANPEAARPGGSATVAGPIAPRAGAPGGP